MSVMIERRIEKLEGAMLPPAPKAITILIEPKAGAPGGAAHQQDVSEAKRTHDLVIIVRPGELRTFEERGCTICGSEFEAQLIHAANLPPSVAGYRNQLEEILRNLGGNVIQVSAGLSRGAKNRRGEPS